MGSINLLFSRLKSRGFFELNFYRVHVFYFAFTILLTSVILWGSGAKGNSNNDNARFALSYIDALFLCTSAMTNTGLNTVNLSSITAFQQSILFILMLMGNVTIVSTATVLVRRHWFRKHMQEFLAKSKGGRKMLDDIEREEEGKEKGSTSGMDRNTPVLKQRRNERKKDQPPRQQRPYRSNHHEKGHGGFSYPWGWSITRNFRSKLRAGRASGHNKSHHYSSFQPSLDEKVLIYPHHC